MLEAFERKALSSGWLMERLRAPEARSGGDQLMSPIGSVRISTSLAALVIRTSEMSTRLPCAENSGLWFSDVPADLELAKAACRQCPLRRPCLAGAVERAEACGVWGGEIFESGVIIAYKRPRGRPSRQPAREDRTR